MYLVFCGCTNLWEITLPDNLSTIEEGAFSDCESLNKIVLPENIVFIGNYAFLHDNNLKVIYCKPSTPPSLDAYCEFPSSTKIYVPTKSVNAYKRANGWKEYADQIVGYDF